MANSVYTFVSVNFATDEAAKSFQNRINPNGNVDEIISEHVIPGLDNTRDAWIDAVGAKWCFVIDQDITDQSVTLHLESAWSFPEELMLSLLVIARKIEGFVDMTARYEDEGLCFVGAFAANSESTDLEEQDYDSLRAGFCDPRNMDPDTLVDCYPDYYDEFRDYVDEQIDMMMENVESFITQS